jgi:hypothetical protein
MQYQANPSTDFFQTSHVALPWVIYSPYISRFCGDRLTTKLLQSPAIALQPLVPHLHAISDSNYLFCRYHNHCVLFSKNACKVFMHNERFCLILPFHLSVVFVVALLMASCSNCSFLWERKAQTSSSLLSPDS